VKAREAFSRRRELLREKLKSNKAVIRSYCACKRTAYCQFVIK